MIFLQLKLVLLQVLTGPFIHLVINAPETEVAASGQI